MSAPGDAAGPSIEAPGERAGWATRLIAGRPGAVLAAIAALTLAALSQLVDFRDGSLRIGIDPSLDPLVAPDDPLRLQYDQVRWRFGNDETVLVVLSAPDILAPAELRRLDRLTRALGELPGIDKASSLTSVPLPRAVDDQLLLERLRPADFDDPALPGRLRAAIAANPLVRGHLASADGRAAAIVLTLASADDKDFRALGLYPRIRALADAEAGPGVQVWITGAPVVREAIREAVAEQLRWVLPAIVLLLCTLLALAFRSLRGVILPVATIALALVWTFGALAATGRPINLITSLVPPLLATMSLAYCAHVLSEFESLAREGALDARARIVRLLQLLGGPVALTGLTTAVGLLALMTGTLPAIREFAWLSALGVAFTALLALTFLPAALAFSRPPRVPHRLPVAGLFERSARRLGRFDVRNRGPILALSGLALLGALALSSQIRIGDQFVGVFEPEARVRADYDAINRALGGVNSVLVQLDGASAGSFTEPRQLEAVARLQAWIAAQPEVGATSSVVDHLRVLGPALAGLPEGALPADANLASQLLFFGDSEVLRGTLNSDRSSTLLRVRLLVDDTASVAAFLDRLEPELARLPAGVSARVTGSTVMVTRSVQSVTVDQLQSIGLALLLVYLCLATQFASLKIGLLASLPTLLQTALYFGGLGASGVMLNATTSLVECLVLGLAVDDTIHYLARFNTAAKATGSESRGAVSALSAVLRPVTLTKAILALGFLMLVTGELHNQVLFGWLAAFTLLAAWLVDIFVTPAFMSGVRVVTLWDSLRLNLGSDIQSTIPLFAGLSNRQARIFALMARLQSVPAGTRLMTEGESAGAGDPGDPAGDIYVVIEGELVVWIERDGERIELNRVGRGAVLGEIGYFGQKRIANVDATTPARLLRFDDADQDRICRQYPRVASRVFLNLNRLQAARRAAQSTAPG